MISWRCRFACCLAPQVLVSKQGSPAFGVDRSARDGSRATAHVSGSRLAVCLHQVRGSAAGERQRAAGSGQRQSRGAASETAHDRLLPRSSNPKGEAAKEEQTKSKAASRSRRQRLDLGWQAVGNHSSAQHKSQRRDEDDEYASVRATRHVVSRTSGRVSRSDGSSSETPLKGGSLKK